jgi:hypothetical protein
MSKSIVSADIKAQAEIEELARKHFVPKKNKDAEVYTQVVGHNPNGWKKHLKSFNAGFIEGKQTQFKESQPTEAERMKWVKASERMPKRGGLYNVRALTAGMVGGQAYFNGVLFEVLGIHENEIEWLDESLDSTPNTQADEDVRDYEASDNNSLKVPCDAPFKDSNSNHQ